MRKKFESIKVDEEGIKKLNSLVEASGLTKSQVIRRYLPTPDVVKRDRLNSIFNELKLLFPQKGEILESMRFIILYSDSLKKNSMPQCDREIANQLNDLSHRVMRVKKGETVVKVFHQSIPPKGGTEGKVGEESQKRGDREDNSHHVNTHILPVSDLPDSSCEIEEALKND